MHLFLYLNTFCAPSDLLGKGPLQDPRTLPLNTFARYRMNAGRLGSSSRWANVWQEVMSPSAVEMIKVGRMTALSKRDGGVRRVACVVKKVGPRTLAQHLGEAVKKATAHFKMQIPP